MVHVETSDFRELLHPAKLDLGKRITASGRKSFTFSQATVLDGACISLTLATYVNPMAAVSADRS